MNPNIIKIFHLSSNDVNLLKDEDRLIKNDKITSNNNNLPNKILFIFIKIISSKKILYAKIMILPKTLTQRIFILSYSKIIQIILILTILFLIPFI